MNLLREKFESENTTFIVITESHLISDYLEGDVHMKGFGSFRAGKVNGVKKGGIITYIRDGLVTGGSNIISGWIGGIKFIILMVKSLNCFIKCNLQSTFSNNYQFQTGY